VHVCVYSSSWLRSGETGPRLFSYVIYTRSRAAE
jgi:hypothetical protein